MRGRCCIILGLFLVAGCGGSSVVPVSGTVKLNGQPLPNATVVFQPTDGANPGPGSVGKTDANGRYELRLATSDLPGAHVGKHTVSITAYSGDGTVESSAPPTADKPAVVAKALVPEEYNAKTTLTFDVPAGGTTKADFELTAAPAPK